MDKRDYKAMNDDLKSAEEVLEKNSTFHFRAKHKVNPKDIVWNICPRDAIKSMEEYADQFKNQLKEKEEEMESLKMKLSAMKIGVDYPKKITELQEQLAESNEMNERLASAVRDWNDGDPILDEYNEFKNSKK